MPVGGILTRALGDNPDAELWEVRNSFDTALNTSMGEGMQRLKRKDEFVPDKTEVKRKYV